MIFWSDDPEYFVPLGQGGREAQCAGQFRDALGLPRTDAHLRGRGELGDSAARCPVEMDLP